MDALLAMKQWYSIDESTHKLLIAIGIKLGIFLLFIFLSVILGKSVPRFLNVVMRRVAPPPIYQVYNNIFNPLEKILGIFATLILVSVCLNFIQEYTGFYQFFKFFSELSIAVSCAILISAIFRTFLRVYGIDLIRKLGLEVDELLLVFETIANIVIGFFVAVAFAQSQNVNLIGLVAGLGIGGIAVAFASQKTLEQIFGTVVIYLDRPLHTRRIYSR